MLKRKTVIAILVLSMILVNITVLAASSEIQPGGVNVSINPINCKQIEFTELDTELLPRQVKKYLDIKKGKLIDSIAVVYTLIIDKETNETRIIKDKKFDFSSKYDIVKYNEYIEEQMNFISQRNNIIARSEFEDSVQYAYISVGLNIDEFTKSGYEKAYQLHGWWEWSRDAIGAFRALYDTMGLTWEYPFYNFPESNNGWANGVYSGAPIDIELIDRNSNSGILFEQSYHDALSEGAVLGQIGKVTYDGTPFDVNFCYFDNNHDTDGSNWGIIDYFWEVIDVPMPTFESDEYPGGSITLP